MIYSINVLKSLSRRRRKMRDSYIANVKMLVSAGVAVGALFLGGAVVSADEYTVQNGDTIWDIAQAHDTTIENIENLNPTIDKTTHLIQIGDKLELDSENTQVQTVQQDEVQVDSAQTGSQYYYYDEPQTPVVQQQTPVQNNSSNVEQEQQNNGSVKSQFLAAGGTEAMWSTIVMPESGGNVNASNGQYHGLGQTNQSWGYGSIDNQTKGMIQYANERYGSINGALSFRQSHGWW